MNPSLYNRITMQRIALSVIMVSLFCVFTPQYAHTAGVASYIYSPLRSIDEIKLQSDAFPENEDLKTLRDFFYTSEGPKEEIVKAYVTGAVTPYTLGIIGAFNGIISFAEGRHLYYADTGLLYSAILAASGESDSDEAIALGLGCLNYYFVAKNTHPVVNEFAGAPYGLPGTHEIVDFDNDHVRKDEEGEPILIIPSAQETKSRHCFFLKFYHNVHRTSHLSQ